MVQIEAPSTPVCHDGVQSQGGQRREKHRVVHQVQEEHYEGHIQWAWVIVTGVQVIPGVQWEECIEPWTINQGLTLSTIQSSLNIFCFAIFNKIAWIVPKNYISYFWNIDVEVYFV